MLRARRHSVRAYEIATNLSGDKWATERQQLLLWDFISRHKLHKTNNLERQPAVGLEPTTV